MKCLIVYAHPEENSFNAAMRNLARDTLTEKNWEVRVSDLYRMKFKPLADRSDFLAPADPHHINYVMEQKNASQNNLYSRDIIEEQEKIRWADFLLLQFPVWWFSVPAILKGWFDRVLTAGFAWDFGRIYDQGLLAGKKGMAAVTTGGPAQLYAAEGLHGANLEQVLCAVTHGTLYFCGIDVLPSFAAYAVFQAGDEKRKEYLRDYKERLLNLDAIAPMKFPKLPDLGMNTD